MNTGFNRYHTTWKETWTQQSDTGQLSAAQWLIYSLGIRRKKEEKRPARASSVGKDGKAAQDDARVPHMGHLDYHMFTLPRALAPIAAHWVLYRLTGWTGDWRFAFVWYGLAYAAFSVAAGKRSRRLAEQFGYLDSEHPRDWHSSTRSCHASTRFCGPC